MPMNSDKRWVEARGGYLYAKIEGDFSAENNLEQARGVIGECSRLGARSVLFDVTSQAGKVSFLSRFHAGNEAANFWDHSVKLALLMREDQREKEDIGILAARNRGINVQDFADLNEAVAWLLA